MTRPRPFPAVPSRPLLPAPPPSIFLSPRPMHCTVLCQWRHDHRRRNLVRSCHALECNEWGVRGRHPFVVLPHGPHAVWCRPKQRRVGGRVHRGPIRFVRRGRLRCACRWQRTTHPDHNPPFQRRVSWKVTREVACVLVAAAPRAGCPVLLVPCLCVFVCVCVCVCVYVCARSASGRGWHLGRPEGDYRTHGWTGAIHDANVTDPHPRSGHGGTGVQAATRSPFVLYCRAVYVRWRWICAVITGDGG